MTLPLLTRMYRELIYQNCTQIMENLWKICCAIPVNAIWFLVILKFHHSDVQYTVFNENNRFIWRSTYMCCLNPELQPLNRKSLNKQTSKQSSLLAPLPVSMSVNCDRLTFSYNMKNQKLI